MEHRGHALRLLETIGGQEGGLPRDERIALAQVHASLAVEEALREAMALAESMVPAPFRRRRAAG